MSAHHLHVGTADTLLTRPIRHSTIFMSLYHLPLPCSLPGWPGSLPTKACKSNIDMNPPPESTPLKQNLASQSEFTTEQFKAQAVRAMLAEELHNAVFCNIEGVWNKYLAASVDVSPLQPTEAHRPGVGVVPSLKEVTFVPWLVNTLNGIASEANRSTTPTPRTSGPQTPQNQAPQYHWLDSKSKGFLGASSTLRRPDFVLVSTRFGLDGITWASVHVVGEHQSGKNSEADCILQLADYVSQIFAHQVTRMFVHAILSYNNRQGGVKLFIFDRAGAVASTRRALQLQLPEIAVAYASMSRARLGYNEQCLVVRGDIDAKIPKLSLLLSLGREAVLQQTLCRRPGIVTRGTFCAVAVPQLQTGCSDVILNSSAIDRQTGPAAVVVKLSWRAATRTNEGELLKAAADLNVIGVAQYISHRDLGDICLLRGDIVATEPAQVFHPGKSGSQPPSRGGSSRTQSSRSRSGIPSDTELPFSPPAMGSSGLPSSRGRSSAAEEARSVLGTSSSCLSSIPEALVGPLAAMSIQPTAYQARIRELNRIHTLIVTTPVGTPIKQCTSAAQVGQALLGALIGHASLYFRGHILHRDISINNIMYTSVPFPVTSADLASHHTEFLPTSCQPLPNSASAAAIQLELHGFLIDLDYAIQHPAKAASGAPHRTGTLPFMSINVLDDGTHTYNDDLESFLYVLLWTCIVSMEGRVAPGSLLLDWVDGRRFQLAGSKLHRMTNLVLFEKLLGAFRPEYVGLKGLARRWRRLLFGREQGWLVGARMENGVSGVQPWDAFVEAREACWEELQGININIDGEAGSL